MAREVYTGRMYISGKDMFARVSQCVALGLHDNKDPIGGIAHLHYNQNANEEYKKFLDDFFQDILSKAKKLDSIYVAGGCNAFVPGLGFIAGEKTAENVLDYVRGNLPDLEIVDDVGGDLIRKIQIDPAMRQGAIYRLKD